MTATSYRALLRSLLRQPNLTSDALLIVADGLDATEHLPGADAEEAVRVARLMRALAPEFAAVPVEPPPPSPDAKAYAITVILACYEPWPFDLEQLADGAAGELCEGTRNMLRTLAVAARERDNTLRALSQRFAVHPA
jgi:hypothetical protein